MFDHLIVTIITYLLTITNQYDLQRYNSRKAVISDGTFWGPPTCRVSHCVIAPYFYCSPVCRPHLEEKKKEKPHGNGPSAWFILHFRRGEETKGEGVIGKERRKDETRQAVKISRNKRKTRGEAETSAALHLPRGFNETTGYSWLGTRRII